MHPRRGADGMRDGCIHPYRDIQGEYGRVPYGLAGSVSMAAAGCYGLLQRYLCQGGYARVGLARLASLAGVQRQTVSTWLQELAGAGWLVIERRRHGLNRYWFAVPSAVSACVPETEHKVKGRACVAETEHKAACVAETEHKAAPPPCVRKTDHYEKNNNTARTHVREGAVDGGADDDFEDVVTELVDGWGVRRGMALEAARSRPLDEVRLAIVGCTRAIDREGRPVRNPSGYVVRAIREGWYVNEEGEKARAYAEQQASRLAAALVKRVDESSARSREEQVAAETAELAAAFEADMDNAPRRSAFGAHVEGIEGWRSALVLPGWRGWLAGRGARHQGLLAEWSEWSEQHNEEG